MDKGQTLADILIIDDDIHLCLTLSIVLEKSGHIPVYVHSASQGMQEAASRDYDVVFLDVMLPDGSGLDILPMICRARSNPEVIIITGSGDPADVESAVESGAWDYIEKSSSPKAMMFSLKRALQYREKKQAVQPAVAFKRDGIIGEAPVFDQCLDLLAQVANSDSNVLITGETGTGKELFANAIHRNSSRRNEMFVIVDCAALPETLVGSILFGHRKGSFTGADSTQEGLLSQADKGTLFLDEVGELPLSIQKDFLRTIQERRFRPIGDSREKESNFRLIAATNRNLNQMVRDQAFRKDLLYRLDVFHVTIPALRDRKEDLKSLSMYHVNRLCDNYGIDTKGFSPDFFGALNAYDWPGNVRELFNALDRAVTSAINEPTLFPKHLPKHIRAKVIQASLRNQHQETDIQLAPDSDFLDRHGRLFPFKDFREHQERRYLEELMHQSNGVRQDACRLSGLSRTRLFELIRKHDL